MLKNKIKYLLLLAAVGVLSILYNQYVMGILFLTVLAMPFVLFALLSYIYGFVRAELISNVHVANKGEMIPVTVQLSNPTIFPVSNLTISLTYKNSFSTKTYRKELQASVDRRTKSNVTCNILSEFSGNLIISVSSIRIFDYMKLFSMRRKLKTEIKIAVLPKFHEVAENYLSNRNRSVIESDYYSQVKSGDDPSEVFAIREYREGDRPQRIHWKLSVKQDQLMIKDFSDPLNCSVLAFVDFCIPKGEDILIYMDALLESALSLSYSFLMKGQIHYFSWYDAKHGICQRIRVMQEKDLFEAVDGLMQSIPYTVETDAFQAYLAEHPNDQYTDLFYVSGDISEARLESLSMLNTSTRNILYVNDYFRNPESNGNGHHRKPRVPEILREKTEELGIGLLPVDVGNIKSAMEQLQLG